MRNFISFSILYLIIVSNLQAKQLEFVLELFRHGSRNPYRTMWENDKLLPDGELTSVGMRQQYNLGKAIKSKYIENLKFIKKNYDPEEVYVRSASTPRVIQSAQSQLLGIFEGSGPEIPMNISEKLLYPPYSESILSVKNKIEALPYRFQPIPIKTIPKNEDFSLEASSECKSIPEEVKNILETIPMKTLAKKTVKSRSYLGKILYKNETLASIYDSYDFFDSLVSHEYVGENIPFNITKEIREELELIYHVDMYYGFLGSKKIQKIVGGKLLEEIKEYIYKFQMRKSNYKLVLIAGHDINIAAFLNIMEISDPLCELYKRKEKCFPFPSFASQLFIEVFKNENGSREIVISFNGEVIKSYEINEFVKILSKNIPKNFEDICNS